MWKKRLLFLFILTMFCTTVFASVPTNRDLPRIYFFERYVYEEDLSSDCLFFFSSGKISNAKKENVYLFFSTLEMNEVTVRNVYPIFSTLSLKEAIHIEQITAFSSKINYLFHSFQYDKIHSYPQFLQAFESREVNGNTIVFQNEVPYFIFILLFVWIKLFLCRIFLGLKQGFFEQGSLLIPHNYINIGKYGIPVYLGFIFFILVFSVTLIGLPVSLLLLLLFYGLFLGGQVCIAVFIGRCITRHFHIKQSEFSDMLVGILLLEFLSFLPFLIYILKLIVYPIFSLGVVIFNFYNWFLRKKFYDPVYGDPPKKTSTNMRSIVLNGVSNDSNKKQG